MSSWQGYVRAIVESDVPLHFVSWHWYANYPRLGPDGPEGDVADEAYNLLAGINRIATPRSYTTLTERVRRTIAPILQPAGRTPALIVDEWNLSAGGYDLRHDSHVGAAFAAGALIEMERVGLDAANVYRSIPSSEHPGDWSIVELGGAKKPIWWVFRTWAQMTGDRLRVEGDDPAKGLWARATSANGEVHVLLTTFVATGGVARPLRVEIGGDCAATTAELGTLDDASSSFEPTRELAVDHGAMSIDLPANSVGVDSGAVCWCAVAAAVALRGPHPLTPSPRIGREEECWVIASPGRARPRLTPSLPLSLPWERGLGGEEGGLPSGPTVAPLVERGRAVCVRKNLAPRGNGARGVMVHNVIEPAGSGRGSRCHPKLERSSPRR